MARPFRCPYCGSSKNIAKGFRRNKHEKVRLRQCKGCRRRWTVGPVAERDPVPEPAPGHDADERPEPATVAVSERPSTEQAGSVPPEEQQEDPSERADANREGEPEAI